MKFSGHETFPLRQGWLHKGVRLLVESPEKWNDEYVADWLGVGSNMAKSIKHWMLSTGVAELMLGKGDLQLTDLGMLIYEKDPYFSDEGTWWILHNNLATNEEKASTWYWFFNKFVQPRFDKPVCLNQLQQYLGYQMKKVPSPNTLDRDIQCMLASYSKVVPNNQDDPEESRESPFTELGLLTHFRLSGSYDLNIGPKNIPAEVLGYSLSHCFGPNLPGGIPILDATTEPNSPGRVFALTSEALYESVTKAEEVTNGRIQLVGLAGERVVRYEAGAPLDWAKAHYQRHTKSGRKRTKLELVG